MALECVVFGVLETESSMGLGLECSCSGFLVAGELIAPGSFLEDRWMECSMEVEHSDGEEGSGRWRRNCCCLEWGRPVRALVPDREVVAGGGTSWRGWVAGRGHWKVGSRSL